MNLYPPFSTFICECKQNSFSRHCNARLSTVKFWDIIENRGCATVVQGFSKPRTTFECIYTNTFMSKVSRGLDKPIPKPLGQDKPRLELALGWICREHRFFTIYTGCSRFIFSSINGPLRPDTTHAIKNNEQNHSRDLRPESREGKKLCANKIQFFFYFDLSVKYSEKCFTQYPNSNELSMEMPCWHQPENSGKIFLATRETHKD